MYFLITLISQTFIVYNHFYIDLSWTETTLTFNYVGKLSLQPLDNYKFSLYRNLGL